MSDKLPVVEKMIAKVMKKKDLPRNAAIDYMLVVATGRLAALWRYDESVPEGKKNKGVLAVVGRKKRAPKSPKIAPPATPADDAKAPTPSGVAKRVKAAKPNPPKRAKAPKPKTPKPTPKPKPGKGEKGEQIEIETAAE